MRDILFRGKQADKDKWIYGMPIRGTVNDEMGMLIIERVFDCEEYACKGCEYTPVIPETVGQYTGLTNKNGKKIFEGDIVKWYSDYDDTWGYSHTAEYYGVVVWSANDYCWNIKVNDELITFNDYDWDISMVIGNIHDNPDLLKGGAEE